ncbi:MAG: hypothetical protein JSS75_11775 [Bacteroidetes bacterium]|nr:hypothetical protein [Bacteroidota bacterium]
MRLFFLLAFVSTVGVYNASAQDEKISTLEGKVDGVTDRVTELENTVSGLSKLKISGYIQPQWQWQDVDSLGSQVNSRNAFTIRRGRVKFVHKTGSIGYTLYPDITENGVVMKEVFADWFATKELTVSMGAMNRPFGYEIAYSSSAREVTERSLFENRFFNGERDLGLQVAYAPNLGGIKPLIELGIFNGTDNFGTGPSGALPGANNKMGFTSAPIGQGTYAVPAGADSLFQVKTNAAVAKETGLQLATQGGLPGGTTGSPIGQPGKELIGHFRVPFLLSDEFSFDIGGSISMGGITEPSQVIGKYEGTNGALVLSNEGKYGNHTFNNQNHTFLPTNRSIIGADAQFYLSVLPIGGTIVKTEFYSGQTPFYGSAKLFTSADYTALGDPIASTIYKNVMGFYAMLVQNLSDELQLAVRYEMFDPNTKVKGTDFFSIDGSGKGSSLRGVSASSGFGGDLAVNTISVDLNVFVSGSMRLMFDYDHPTTEQFTKNGGTSSAPVVATVADAHDDRFTFRMQYKF